MVASDLTGDILYAYQLCDQLCTCVQIYGAHAARRSICACSCMSMHGHAHAILVPRAQMTAHTAAAPKTLDHRKPGRLCYAYGNRPLACEQRHVRDLARANGIRSRQSRVRREARLSPTSNLLRGCIRVTVEPHAIMYKPDTSIRERIAHMQRTRECRNSLAKPCAAAWVNCIH